MTQDQDKTEIEKLTKEGLYTGFKILISYLSQYKKHLISLSLMGIFSAIGNGLIPFIIGKFFDSIIVRTSISILDVVFPFYAILLLTWFVIQLITYVLDWRLNLMSEYLGFYVWSDYIAKGFGFLLTLPISFHKKQKIGEIGSKITQSAYALEVLTGNIIIDLAPQILSILIAFIVAFYIKPVLACVLIAGLIIYILVLLRKVQPLGGHQKEYHDKISKSFGIAYDATENTLAVKQASAEVYEGERIENSMSGAMSPWVSITKIWGILTLFQRFIILFTQVVIFVLSVFYISKGDMTIGELLAFNAYAAMVFGPFIAIVRSWQTIHNGIVNLQETEKILGLSPENYDSHGSIKLNLKGDIEFKNTYFSYEADKTVLQDVSFSVKSGEVIALVGESGVGKSTLIDLISAYHFPDKGQILIDGQRIGNINLRSLRSQIAVVPQEVVLFNDTIEMNIKYGNFNASDKEIIYAARKAHALEFIEKFPLKWEQIVGERGIKLSVGQKQRIAIARAILRNPKILVLDEPTSALDAGSEKIITESLEKLMKGKTTFIIAHRLSTVRKADKIFVFKDGTIVERGNHDELLKIENGEYRKLYELQIGLHQ